MSQYFPPYRSHGGDIKVELDLSSYATKQDLKNITHTYVSSFATKQDLSALKGEVDKLDINKLVPVPNDQKKAEYNKLVPKVDDIDTKDFVKKKNKYEKDGSDFEDKISKIDKKIPDVTDLVKKT